MFKKNYIIGTLSLMIFAFMVAGCGETNQVAAQEVNESSNFIDKTNGERGERPNFNRELMVSGKITSIDADNVTIDIYDFNKEKMEEMRKDRENRGNNEDRGDKPSFDENPPKTRDGNPPEMRDGTPPKGRDFGGGRGFDDMMEATGESKTYTITHAKFMGGSKMRFDRNNENGENELEAQLTYKDFNVGDTVQIILNEDKTSVNMMSKRR